MANRFFKLHSNYAKFTGVLGGVYTVKQGIAFLPESKEDVSPVLTDSYGGVEFKTEEEARKAQAEDLEKLKPVEAKQETKK